MPPASFEPAIPAGERPQTHVLYRAATGIYFYLFIICLHFYMGWASSVGIATRCGLDGPGIESRWGVRFSAPVQTGPGAHPASCTMGTGSFPGVMRPGSGVDHPPRSSAEVKERVELYLCSPSGPSWPVLGWPLLFYSLVGLWMVAACCHNDVINLFQ